MTTTQEVQQEATNSLRYSTTKIIGNESITVKIRLDDECKNGHQDFSITGDIYEAGKPKTDRYFISGGCIHEDIIKHFPEFETFVKLHLCDYNGVPMYAVANGFYHLRNGFNNTKPNDAGFKKQFCDYYRLTPKQFNELNKAENKVQHAITLEKLDVLTQWKEEASAARFYLEQLTGKKFLADSTKSNFDALTQEQREEENKRINEGYYTPAAKQAREELKKNDEVKKLEAERDKEIDKANLEFAVKLQVLNVGGSKALKNCIFYDHTKQLAFNWRGYDMMSESEVSAIIEKLNLPEGVTVKNAKGK